MASEAPTLPANMSDDEVEGADRAVSPKRKHPSDETRLGLRTEDEAPAWLDRLERSLKSDVATVSDNVQALTALLAKEGQNRRHEVAEIHKRIDELAGKVEAVSKQNQSSGYHNVPPPPSGPAQDAWASYRAHRQSPQASTVLPQVVVPQAPSETPDYNHIVMGGWARDTPRREILDAVSASIATWDHKLQEAVMQTIVKGQRARTAHVNLKPLDPEQARERFFMLQERYGKNIPTGTGNSWYSPEKSADSRRKNRSTREAKLVLEKILDKEIALQDMDWQRQLFWIGKQRVCAATADALFAPADSRIISKIVEDEYGEKNTFYFNISILAQATGRTVPTVEQLVHS